jgi:hypothetical protein
VCGGKGHVKHDHGNHGLTTCRCTACHGTGYTVLADNSIKSGENYTEPEWDELHQALSYFGGRYHAAKSGNPDAHGPTILAEAHAAIIRYIEGIVIEARLDEVVWYSNQVGILHKPWDKYEVMRKTALREQRQRLASPPQTDNGEQE